MNKPLLFLMVLLLIGCDPNKSLPKLGNIKVENGDTTYHKIPDFKFINQDSQSVNNADLADFIYIADFFFTSCPSICPKVKKQMLRIYDEFNDEQSLKIVSHTIDPKRDTPDVLKLYAHNLDIETDRWMFLSGEKSEVLDIADDYFVVAYEDEDAPGGFDHSGKIILVDKKRHIRAFCDGTDEKEVDAFMKDIHSLLSEYEN